MRVSRVLSGVSRFSLCLLAGALLATALSGCGLGIVAAIFGAKELSKSDGSGANSPTLVSGVDLANCRTRPATISFVLSDSESDPADVEVSCTSPGGEEVLIADLRGLATSPQGTLHSVGWDFSEEFGTGYTQGITLSVAVGGAEPAVLPAQACGNDAPVVADPRPPPGAEVVGIAQIDFTVRDSSDDQVSILAEYHLINVDPDGEWHPAKPAGSAIRKIQAPRDGTELSFFWDVVHDTGHVTEEVVLRIFADDDLELSHPVETPPFRINNNQAPIVTILASDLQANPDQRRGIPIPFRVRDANRDLVRVLFQWRGSGEAFPELPGTVAGIESILASPALRREKHIASERPRTFEGRLAVPDPEDDLGGARVRLMELAMTASPLLAAGMVGREIEILRSSEIPKAAGGTWDLRAPVAALPIGDGIRAVVLDRPSPERWRLREVDLGSGEVVSPIAESNEGDPDAMALEPDGDSVLIALHQGGVWKILRVDRETGKPVLLFTSAPPLEPGPVRSLAVLGTGAALVTAGSALIRIQTSGSETPRATTVLAGLNTPWGIAFDPLLPGQVYLAERDWTGAGATGRIIALDLNTHARRTIQGFERPEGIALERNGGRLLVVTSPGGSDRRALRGLDLGAGGDAFAIGGDLPGVIGGLATGADGVRVLALTSANDLAVGGGIAQRRTVTDFNMKLKEATVDPTFRPRLMNQVRWRIRDRLRPVPATPEGVQRTFVWESADAVGGGDVALRAVALDAGIAMPEEVNDVQKTVKGIFSGPPQVLGDGDSTPLPQALAAADLNGDGRVDLISANNTNVTPFFQKDRGTFPSQPSLTLAGFHGAKDVEAADLDGDSLADLAATDASSVKVYFQKGPGAFAAAPDTTLPGLKGPRAVAGGDLDRDGDLDLAVADTQGNRVAVFRQRDQGSRIFEAWKTLAPEPPGVPSEPVSVVLGDLNDDGLADVVSANESANNLTMFFQGPEGLPAAPSLRLGGPDAMQGPESVVLADLNRDGLNDLASANQVSGSLTVFFQKGEGVFSSAPDFSLTDLTGPRGLAVSDLDGDGALDLVSSNLDSNNCALFFHRERGAFVIRPALVPLDRQAGQRPIAVLIRDLDGDGRPDLVTANALSRALTVLENDRGGSFSSEPDLVLGGVPVTKNPSFLSAADLDGNGLLDLLCANEVGADIALFLQQRPRSFEYRQSLKLEGDFTGISVLAVDLDGDGRSEIVGQRTETPYLGVFFQNGPATFEDRPSSRIQITHDAGVGQIIGADLDRDGLLDLASSQAGYTPVFFQEKDGRFSPSQDLPFLNSWGLAAGDFNGDGELDLAGCIATTANPVWVFLQDGPRGFKGTPDLTFGGPALPNVVLSTEAADLDADGWLDLISSGATKVAVFFNAGPPGFFGLLPDLSPGGSDMTSPPVSVAAGDLDGDGSLDIAAANSASDSISIFFQKSPRVFPQEADVTLTGIEGPFWLLVLDLDGDGDLDLFVSSFSGNSLAVYYGSH